MKISRNWLQTFFVAPLPDAQALADALTFHAFEIENISDSKGSPWNIQGLPLDNNAVLDVKVTANRGHDCLSHRGIAKEISAILNIPMKPDPLREPMSGFTKSRHVEVSIDTPLCARYIAGYIKGVKVGPSPDWLRENIESIGQKSINNIVDSANFVMFNIGQPLHAFDANKLGNRQEAKGNSEFRIQIRNARKDEKITTLDNKECVLSESMLVIADGNADTAIGIAGVKGGKTAEVNETTTDIILESANFDGASVRKTAQALKLRTDASQRFEQNISPELAGYGMRAVTDLILKIAGGELVGFADEYPVPQENKQVSVSVTQVNNILGTSLAVKDVADAFTRLGLPYKYSEATPRGIFEVEVPFERLDLEIAEDLAEEVARIAGYDKIPAVGLPALKGKPEINENFARSESIREELMSKGYSEVVTSVFTDKGNREVLNKVGGERPYLRTNLTDGLAQALEKNIRNKDILGLKEVRLFEIGAIWDSKKEEIAVGQIGEKEKAMQTVLSKYKTDISSEQTDLPISTTARYQTFSRYPFIVRDIALWVPEGTKSEQVLEVISKQAGALVVRSELFDTFGKAGKTSYAFRLVLQSFEKTLTDGEANEAMENVYKEVKKKGWEVR
ncbi:MAG: phenylalanine--tRNA ligase subunit beta [Candidatus Kaiserbacteria bacterium]|nr:phenylalanine--tRNA ligase subunit beta [Candidatus Kaiserbacteria bacterium]